MTIDAVIGDIKRAFGEPFRVWRIQPIQQGAERRGPGQPVGLLGPERLWILGGPLVNLRLEFADATNPATGRTSGPRYPDRSTSHS